jgi:hypothetical protein
VLGAEHPRSVAWLAQLALALELEELDELAHERSDAVRPVLRAARAPSWCMIPSCLFSRSTVSVARRNPRTDALEISTQAAVTQTGGAVTR